MLQLSPVKFQSRVPLHVRPFGCTIPIGDDLELNFKHTLTAGNDFNSICCCYCQAGEKKGDVEYCLQACWGCENQHEQKGSSAIEEIAATEVVY